MKHFFWDVSFVCFMVVMHFGAVTRAQYASSKSCSLLYYTC